MDKQKIKNMFGWLCGIAVLAYLIYSGLKHGGFYKGVLCGFIVVMFVEKLVARWQGNK